MRLVADARSAVSDALSEHGIQYVLTRPPLRPAKSLRIYELFVIIYGEFMEIYV